MKKQKSSGLGRLRDAGALLLRSRRRGSFLVLVVGTLAMLSIIMIVYVAVGSSDKRSSRSLERRTRSDEVIALFSDYVAQIVADDAVAVAPDPSNTKADGTPQTLAGGDVYVREAWDAPVTKWNVSSSISPGTTLANEKPKVFRTVGAGDDPWLASTTPTWINFDAATNGLTLTGTDGDKKTFAKRRDWLHISNIAPDGRFVNLFNLRGNFDARPGTQQTVGDEHMNGNLSLTDPLGVEVATTAWKEQLGSPTVLSSNYHNPATFDSWQVGAFRPARGPFKNGASDIAPNDPAYPPYQWADADGDGFFDSRWFEMVDSRDPGNTANVQSPQWFRKLLPTDPNYRWVFAARIIDLSALVNVNTSGDDSANPNYTAWAENPAIKAANGKNPKGQVMGLNPADIDLRRLFSMRDSTESVLNGSATGLLIDGVSFDGGYSAIAFPTGGKPASQDYRLYNEKPNDPNTEVGTAQDLGWGAYEALRATLNIGRPPGRFSDFTVVPLLNSKNSFATLGERAEFYRRAAPAVARPAYRATDTSRGDPTELYLSGSGGLPSTVTGAIDYGLGFRLSNLLELMTYRSVNDPSVSSSLESAVGGKRRSKFATKPTTADLSAPGESFGPLRENRSLELERENLAYTTGAKIGQPTEAAMLRSFTDVRQYLTTLSGARPIRATSVVVTSVDQPPPLTEDELSTEVPQNPTGEELFKAYTSALMPGLKLYQPDSSLGTPVDIWKDITTGTSLELRGMFYGGQGPISALLAAGHMAANFATSAELKTGTVSHAPYVLVMADPVYTKDSPASLPSDTLNQTDWKKYFPTWWTDAGRRLNIARDDQTTPRGAQLSVDKSQPIPAPAVNIYGMGNPHPFLTDVASITVYRDVPWQLPPIENAGKSDQEDQILGDPPVPQFITVNGFLGDANNDFMFRAVAVKLHNPYQAPIVLSKNVPTGSFRTDGTGTQFTANSFDDFFYIQIGSGTDATFYVLAEVEEAKSGGTYGDEFSAKPVVILPGETIVFYALSRDKKFIVRERFNGTDEELKGNQDPTQFDLWLETQFGKQSDTLMRRIQMVRVDNDKFRTGVAANATFAFSQTTATQMVPAYTGTTPPDSTVLLRRAVRIDSGDVNDTLASAPNSITNDQVCDRLRLGTAFTLDRKLKSASPPGSTTYKAATAVDGLWARPDFVGETITGFKYKGVVYPRNWNTRFTVALVEHVGRKNEETGANYKMGMLPAWAIDPKDEPASGWYMKTQRPDAQSANEIKLTDAIVSAQTNLKTSAYNPADWKKLGAYIPSMPKRAEERTDKLDKKNKQGTAFEDLRREMAVNANRYEGFTDTWQPDGTSQIRPTDLLNVMAIGSTQVPLDINGTPLEVSPNVPDMMKQWTTTAEVLAIAMGFADRTKYDYVAGQTEFGPLDYYYFDLVSPAASAKPLFDGGYLRLDDFVAMRADTSGGQYTAGIGAPIAGNILSAFRVHPDAFASLHIATPGLVNINTAPQAVLRVLPMVFPSTNPFLSSEDKANGRTERTTFWPGADEAERKQEAPKTDIAAMIESYRDKIPVELRPKAKNAGGGTGAPTVYASFFDRTDKNLAATAGTLAAPSDPKIGDYSNLNGNPNTYTGGRYWSTGLRGIREGAGLQSVGELLAVRHVEFNTTTNAVSTPASDLEKRPSNIDFMGYRSTPSNMYGIDNLMERVLDSSDPEKPVTTDIKPLQFGKTYQDKLKVLSALLGSVTVRSDMYAVWFIARGYQRSDVEGLPNTQPMAPSIERRFLMIIDRSNVTKVGQKPRVLAFVELPL